jgi:hypothetical protein
MIELIIIDNSNQKEFIARIMVKNNQFIPRVGELLSLDDGKNWYIITTIAHNINPEKRCVLIYVDDKRAGAEFISLLG